MERILNPFLTYFVSKDCPLSWILRPMDINFYDMVFVLDGAADYMINGNAYHVKRGELIFIRPGSSRSATTATGMRCVAFDFHLDAVEALDFPVVSPIAAMGELLPLFDEFNYAWLQKEDGYQIKCRGLFLLILHRVLYGDKPAAPNIHVEIIKRYIVEHIQEKLSVRRLADVAGINPVYCGALFKKTERCTLSAYINRIRINKAAALLEKGECNVGEAAGHTGFTDIYYFSSTFKKILGVSPAAYRKLKTQTANSPLSIEVEYSK